MHFAKQLSQGFIVRAVDVNVFDADTYGEHATQTKIMRDAYCRSTFRTDNQRLLQMETNRHALHRKCYDLGPKRPRLDRDSLNPTECLPPPCSSTEIGKRS